MKDMNVSSVLPETATANIRRVRPTPCTPPPDPAKKQAGEKYKDVVKTMKRKRAIEKRARIDQYFQR